MDAILGALKSKTMWAAIALLLFGNVAQPVQDWVSANPGLFATAVSVLFAALRSFTTQSLSEKGNPPGQPPSP